MSSRCQAADNAAWLPSLCDPSYVCRSSRDSPAPWHRLRLECSLERDLSAGLAEERAIVCVGPPLFCTGPSRGSWLFKSPRCFLLSLPPQNSNETRNQNRPAGSCLGSGVVAIVALTQAILVVSGLAAHATKRNSTIFDTPNLRHTSGEDRPLRCKRTRGQRCHHLHITSTQTSRELLGFSDAG